MPSNASRLDFQKFGVDSNIESGLGYTSTTAWAAIRGYDSTGTERVIHFLLVQADPNGDTAHDNAPNGSLAVDIVNFKLWQKTAASTWTNVASNT